MGATAEPVGRGEALAARIEECVRFAFPTPIATHLWPGSEALNRDLAELILAEEGASPSAGRSNVGGWRSGNDFALRREPALERMMGRVRALTGAMTGMMRTPGPLRVSVEGWANVLRRGQYNSVHQHPNATWSVVYYVTGAQPPAPDEGDPAFSGKIEFVDPRPGASASYTVESAMQRRVMLDPAPGAMLAFPAWLPHLVHPYFGEAPRISLAYNVLVMPGTER